MGTLKLLSGCAQYENWRRLDSTLFYVISIITLAAYFPECLIVVTFPANSSLFCPGISSLPKFLHRFHYVGESFDTGDIIVQKLVEFDVEVETLATSYQKLQDEIQALFKEHWFLIKSGKCVRHKQPVEGSLHRARDKEQFTYLFTDGWNTPVSVLCEYAGDVEMSRTFWDKYDREIMQRSNQHWILKSGTQLAHSQSEPINISAALHCPAA